MEDDIILIIGLGNPGDKYENTRHNIGFKIIDYFASEIFTNVNFENKFSGNLKKGDWNNTKLLLFKPMNYMNNSGIPVSKIKNFFKIKINNIIVIHDDLDLYFGKIKTKLGGSSGGHNGLKSIDSYIGKNYWRLRIGIGKPKEIKNTNVPDYVLSNFTNDQLSSMKDIIKNLNSIFDYIVYKTQLVSQEYNNKFLTNKKNNL